MKKKLMTMLFAVCFMVWFSPVNAFATTTVDWSNIKSAVDGACHNGETDIDNNGNGWSYTHVNDTVTIADGTTVTGYVNTYFSASGPGNIQNIHSEGGIFTGTIEGGNFTGAVFNAGTIDGGTFNGTVTNNADATIKSGTFTETSKVINNSGATISNATSEGIVENYGNITGGNFNKIINYSGGTINENNVHCNNVVDGNAGGNDDDNDTPNPNPGDNNLNSENTTSDDNKYEFVEPIIIVVPEGQKYVDDVMEQLTTVPTDGKVVIDTKDWYCFNRTMAEKVTSMKDTTVTIKYLYQGKKYEVTIPAGSDIVSLLDENGFVGFRYLDAVFGGKEITE